MRQRHLIPALVALAVLVSGPAHGRDASEPTDATARAAIIYNFIRFSSWDSDRFANASSPVVLCVQPTHALAARVAAFDGRQVGERTLQIRNTANFARGCHAALVGDGDANAAALDALARAGVLTIGDARGFIGHGAIGMITVGRQIRFEINNRVARDAGVELSSRLLRLAVLVR